MSYEIIQSLFESELKALADSESIPVAWDGEPMRDDVAPVYFTPAFLPAEPEMASVGSNGEDKLQGLFQISVRTPRDGTMGPVRRLVDELVRTFGRGKYLKAGSVSVTCERAWPAPSVLAETWVSVPVTVRWYSYATGR